MKAQLPTIEKLHEMFLLDTARGKLTWKVRPLHHFKNAHGMNTSNSKYAGTVAGCVGTAGYGYVFIEKRLYRVHRVIYAMGHGCWPSGHVDHIDGDVSNNRLNNLRDVPHQVNNQNLRKAHKDSGTGLLGVTTDKRNGKFIAQIWTEGKQKRIGYFDCPHEAHQAYVLAKRELHAGNTL